MIKCPHIYKLVHLLRMYLFLYIKKTVWSKCSYLQDLDETTERKKMFLLEQELEDQKEVNKQLKAYVGDVLINIIVQNPDILEKKSQQ